MPADYFAPAFSVQVNNRLLAADVSKNIIAVSVTTQPNSLDSFSLTLTNPMPQMRWTHTADALLFAEGNSVTVQMGYGGKLQTMIEGEILSLSPSFPDSGTPTLQVRGHNLLHRLNERRRTRTFQHMTDAEIIEQIALEAGLVAEVLETPIRHAHIGQWNQTDLEFVLERAAVLNYTVLVRGRILLFYPAAFDLSRTYTLTWGQNLKSFHPTLDLRKQVGSVVVTGYDPKTGLPIRAEAGSGDRIIEAAGVISGPEVAAQALGRPTEDVFVDRPPSSLEEAAQYAQALYNARAMQFVTGDGSTIGLPDLRTGGWILLDGLGPRFSGLYYLTETTHTIDASGYQTSFRVSRAGLGLPVGVGG